MKGHETAVTPNFLLYDWPDGAGHVAGRAWVGDFPFQSGGSRGGPDSWERCSRGGGGGQEMNGARGESSRRAAAGARARKWAVTAGKWMSLCRTGLREPYMGI